MFIIPLTGLWRLRVKGINKMAEHISRVLVVDDEEEIRKILSRILEKEGFEVITAPDGEQALQKICFDTPDMSVL